jgi:beta-xylosidase
VQWYHLRTPLVPTYSLSIKPSYLTLFGSPQKITDVESPSMLLRRQTSYDGTWKTRMIYEPADEWEEAGTTVFYSRWSFIAIIVRKNKEGKKEIVARWTDADDKKAIKVHYLRLEAELNN